VSGNANSKWVFTTREKQEAIDEEWEDYTE
jgi:hypothetical protein